MSTRIPAGKVLPKFFIIFFCCLLILLSAMALPELLSSKHVAAHPGLADTSAVSDSIISVIGVGDIMMGSNYPDNSRLPKDCNALFAEVKPYLQNADICFGNLEGMLHDSAKVQKKCTDSTVLHLFRQPTAYSAVLKESGFNFISIANNHLNDFGRAAILSTERVLKKDSISVAGFISRPGCTRIVNGKKIGFAAFSFNSNTVSINDSAKVTSIIAGLDTACDIVIVSFHGGTEGKGASQVTGKTEYFKEENRGNPLRFAHIAIDAGADIVFGHGPHVSRAVELYKDRFIAYSLGNFCTTAGISVAGSNGAAPIINIKVNKKGEFCSGEIISTRQKYLQGPHIDLKNRALNEIKRLTSANFPNGQLIISDDGKISKAVIGGIERTK